MAVTIPAEPHEISAEWLTRALKAAGTIGDETVAEVRSEIIGQEWGFTGVVARLHLKYMSGSDSCLPPTLIAKLPHATRDVASAYQASQVLSPQARQAMLDRAAREVRFFTELVPGDLDVLPACYFGAVDAEASTAVLILEDVSDGEVGDALLGCAPHEAERVARAIGTWHARWWEHKRTISRDWLTRPTTHPHARQVRYMDTIPLFCQRFGDTLPDDVRALLNAIGPRVARVVEASHAAPTTVIHGDLHLDNVIFVQGEAGAGVRIIDWQTVSAGSGAQDIAMFISGAIDAQEQPVLGQHLLDVYHASLLDRGVVGYDREDLERDVRFWLLRTVIGVVIWLGTADPDAFAGREKALVAAAIGNGRLIAAARSHDLMSAIPD